MTRVVVSASASARRRAASAFLSGIPSGSPVLVVGASRGAADDLVRAVALGSGATFGVFRFSLTELAARAAALTTQALRIPATMASVEAMAARAVFDARQAAELAYFEPVAATPGFPRALARTLHELRLAGVAPPRLTALGPAGSDMGRLLARVEAQLAAAGADDRASLFAAAAAAWRDAPLPGSGDGAGAELPWAGVPVLLLDPTLDSEAEQSFADAVLARATPALVTVPDGDHRALAALRAMDGVVELASDAAATSSDLWHLRKYVFTS